MKLTDVPVTYFAQPMRTDKADEMFIALRDTLDWVRIDKTPRSEYYANDILEPYTYGSKDFARTYNVQPWTPELLELRSLVEYMSECKFETCFLNRYHNQSDHLGWHADNSPEMDDGRPIAIVSLGVARVIWFAQNGNLKEKTVLTLGHGSLALMHAGMQDTHMHRIPKAGFMCGERISLTFRGYVHG